MVVMELQYSGRASPSTMEEEDVLEVGGAAPGEGCGCPPTPSLYIGGRGEGASGAAAKGNLRWVWAPPPPRKLASQAGRGGCPRGGAPTSPGYVRWGGRGAQPLSGLMCPLPLAHKAPQRLPGPPKPLSDTLVITWYPQNNSGLQYPSSNIPIFTSRPFRSSS